MIFGKRNKRVDPVELDRQTAEIEEFLHREGPRMSSISTFLHNRRGQNGLGEDFDITFYPRGASQ